jgi:hypothetical protein
MTTWVCWAEPGYMIGSAWSLSMSKNSLLRRVINNSTQIGSKVCLVVILRELCPCSIRVENAQKCHRLIRLGLEHASSNHLAVQDFCVMGNVLGLAGMVQTTFVIWAAFLLGHGTACLIRTDLRLKKAATCFILSSRMEWASFVVSFYFLKCIRE